MIGAASGIFGCNALYVKEEEMKINLVQLNYCTFIICLDSMFVIKGWQFFSISLQMRAWLVGQSTNFMQNQSIYSTNLYGSLWFGLCDRTPPRRSSTDP